MQVADLSGNQAQPAVRLVRVVCPANETTCSDPLTGLITCTVDQSCGLATLGISADGSVSVANATFATVPPNITLQGLPLVSIPQNGLYER